MRLEAQETFNAVINSYVLSEQEALFHEENQDIASDAAAFEIAQSYANQTKSVEIASDEQPNLVPDPENLYGDGDFLIPIDIPEEYQDVAEEAPVEEIEVLSTGSYYSESLVNEYIASILEQADPLSSNSNEFDLPELLIIGRSSEGVLYLQEQDDFDDLFGRDVGVTGDESSNQSDNGGDQDRSSLNGGGDDDADPPDRPEVDPDDKGGGGGLGVGGGLGGVGKVGVGGGDDDAGGGVLIMGI